ncbi:MAG: ethanolamine utilization protein EutJ [Lachnospirales bacterium]
MLVTNKVLSEFADLVNNGKCNEFKGMLRTGVDLGTANIVLAVIDENNKPIAGATAVSKVIKDGVVVDFIGAIQTVKKLKDELEEKLNATLEIAATAVPPGIVEGNIKCIANVVEGAGFEVINVVDEPTAAATFLNIKDGAVVDVGGGTTGISILKEGKVIYTADEPTGGTHMTLVLAGYYDITFQEAEKIKLDINKDKEIFPIIKPVVQKMASIVKRFIDGYEVKEIYVVGGACSFSEFEETFEKEIGITTIKYEDTLFVTPLGISCNVM